MALMRPSDVRQFMTGRSGRMPLRLLQRHAQYEDGLTGQHCKHAYIRTTVGAVSHSYVPADDIPPNPSPNRPPLLIVRLWPCLIQQ
jgi:hypothetical protein